MPVSYFLEKERNDVNHFNYYYYKNAFTDKELETIFSLGDSYPKQQAVTGGNESVVSDYRISEVSWIPDEKKTQWLFQKVSEYAMEANREMRWNFDIWGYGDAFQYTTYYGDGGHYDWHADLGPGISNRKLSCVLQLSEKDEYEGGDLQMNIGGSIITVERGKNILCFFPSFVLHRVTPLSGGIRKSLVTWLCGANLR